jgi:hypothetical protein
MWDGKTKTQHKPDLAEGAVRVEHCSCDHHHCSRQTDLKELQSGTCFLSQRSRPATMGGRKIGSGVMVFG